MASSWKETIPIDCLPECPWRSLDWRWRLAGHVMDGRKRRQWQDEWLSRAAKFLRAEARVRSRWSRRKVDTAITGALSIWRGGANTRLEIEARLLTGEPFSQTATRCGIDQAIVEAYERLFYSVADVLDARAYVTAMAIPHLRGSRRSPHPETILKSFALNGGPLVLDRVLHVMGIRAAPAGCEPSAREVRVTRLALSARRLTATSPTPGDVNKLTALSEELDRRARDSHYVPIHQPSALLVDPFDAISVDEDLAAELGKKCDTLCRGSTDPHGPPRGGAGCSRYCSSCEVGVASRAMIQIDGSVLSIDAEMVA